MSRFQDSGKALQALANKAESLSRIGPYTRLTASVERLRPAASTQMQEDAPALLDNSLRNEAPAVPDIEGGMRSAKYTLPRPQSRPSNIVPIADYQDKGSNVSKGLIDQVSRIVARWLQK